MRDGGEQNSLPDNEHTRTRLTSAYHLVQPDKFGVQLLAKRLERVFWVIVYTGVDVSPLPTRREADWKANQNVS